MFSRMTLGLALTASIGCASMGTKFDPQKVNALAPGMTLAQVKEQLGKPNNETIMADGRKLEMWLYSHATAFGTGGARSVTLLFTADNRFVRILSQSQTDLH